MNVQLPKTKPPRRRADGRFAPGPDARRNLAGGPRKRVREAQLAAAQTALRDAAKKVTAIVREAAKAAPVKQRHFVREALEQAMRDAAHSAALEVAQDIAAKKTAEAAATVAAEAAQQTTALVLQPLQQLLARVEELRTLPLTPGQLARHSTPAALAIALRTVEDPQAELSDKLRAAEMLLRQGWAQAPAKSLAVHATGDLGRLSDKELLAMLPPAQAPEVPCQALPMPPDDAALPVLPQVLPDTPT